MKKLISLSLPVLVYLFSASALAQKPTYPRPPRPMDSSVATTDVPVYVPLRVDLVKLQKEADDLGMLPKDVIQKLKEIEKLSRGLRSKLNR